MTKYRVKNTSSLTKSYEADNGKRINFERGEEKKVGTLPPEVDDPEGSNAGWGIEEVGSSKSSKEDEEEVNE